MTSHPWDPQDFGRFVEHYFYAPEALLIDEVLRADPETNTIKARCPANNRWLVAPYQRGDEKWHPRHVSGADLLMLTGVLGSLHAYFFHGCRWHEGWVGFGNRIEEAEFKALAHTNLPLDLKSTEVRARRGDRRALLEYQFEFSQEGRPVYTSRQTAMFLKQR